MCKQLGCIKITTLEDPFESTKRIKKYGSAISSILFNIIAAI